LAQNPVPEEEDADDSQVEDPEKCTDEEKVEIIEKVGEALEENFTECEKIKADKEKKDEPQNGDVEMSNGDSKDATALKTNGEVKINGHSKEDSDAKTDGDSKEEVAKTNGDYKEEIVETNGAVEKMDEDKKPGNLATFSFLSLVLGPFYCRFNLYSCLYPTLHCGIISR
jgi:hypothetical protein